MYLFIYNCFWLWDDIIVIMSSQMKQDCIGNKKRFEEDMQKQVVLSLASTTGIFDPGEVTYQEHDNIQPGSYLLGSKCLPKNRCQLNSCI